MTAFKSDFMRIVHERGMVHQCSDAARLDELLASGVRTAYIGFDCTADSLHVGSLLQIMMLRWWQKTGHCLLYTSPSPRDGLLSRMPSSA